MPIESIENHLIGHPEIDADHNRLVNTINRIGEDIEEGTYALCIELFDELETAALSARQIRNSPLSEPRFDESVRPRRIPLWSKLWCSASLRAVIAVT